MFSVIRRSAYLFKLETQSFVCDAQLHVPEGMRAVEMDATPLRIMQKHSVILRPEPIFEALVNAGLHYKSAMLSAYLTDP